MTEIGELQRALESDLLNLYGPVLTGEALWRSLGYISKDAFRQSVTRETVPVPLFTMENRRGKYALAKDVAAFLAKRRYENISN